MASQLKLLIFNFFGLSNKEKVERYLLHVDIFLQYLEQNIEKDKTNLKLENPFTAILCNQFAKYFQEYGLYAKAEKYCEIAKNICEENKDIHEVLLGVSYRQLARLYYLQSRYEESEILTKKSLAIYEKIFGENHSETAADYNALALIYSRLGRPEKAEPLYLKVTIIYEALLGEDHFWTATSYNNLAAFYFDKKDFKLARQYQEKSIKSRLAIFGENHPDIAQSYQWLGSVCLAEKKVQEALKYFYKAHEIFFKFLPEDHPVMQESQKIINMCEPLIEK